MLKFFKRGNAANKLATGYYSISSKLKTLESIYICDLFELQCMEILEDFKKNHMIIDEWDFPPQLKLLVPSFGWTTIGKVESELLLRFSELSNRFDLKNKLFKELNRQLDSDNL